MKIIPFVPDDPADTGIFFKSIRFLVAAYFRSIPAFEIFFIILSLSTILPTSLYTYARKNQSYIRFGSRDSRVIIGTNLTGFESA